MNLGTVLTQTNPLEVKRHYQKAIRLDPNYFEAYCNLSASYLQSGALEDAETTAHKAFTIRPDTFQRNLNLGMVLANQGRPAAAEPFLFKALQLRSVPQLQILLAQVYDRQSKTGEAIEQYRQALQTDRAPLPVAARLAILLSATPTSAGCNPEEALVIARQCVQRTKRNDPVSLEPFAMALAATGDFKQAKSVAEVLDTLQTDPPGHRHWREYLESFSVGNVPKTSELP